MRRGLPVQKGKNMRRILVFIPALILSATVIPGTSRAGDLTFVSSAASPQEEIASKASSAMSMVFRSNDGWTFYASADRTRSIVFGGSDGRLCVGTWRYNVDTTVQPPVMTRLDEGGCSGGPGNYMVDPIAWEASISGSVPTKAERSSYQWNEQRQAWELVSHETWGSTATLDLRWRPSFGLVGGLLLSPVIVGFPLCLTYSLLMPVYPCPSTHVGAGLGRQALVYGSIHFGGLNVSFTGDPALSHAIFPPSLAIWWQT